MLRPGFRLFNVGGPADPFVTGEGSDIFPKCQRLFIGCQSLVQIVGQVMYARNQRGKNENSAAAK